MHVSLVSLATPFPRIGVWHVRPITCVLQCTCTCTFIFECLVLAYTMDLMNQSSLVSRLPDVLKRLGSLGMRLEYM